MGRPGDEIAAGAGGHGHLRVSHADREQVIDALEVAFVQGRLTNDELDARAGRALVARTHAELAAVTAGIPAGPDLAQPPKPARAQPRQPGNRAAKWAVKAGMTEAEEVRRGYEQFVPQQAPPGMYFDPASELFLPQGVRLASRGQVAAAWFLGLLLFSVTLGIGYIAWSLFAWGQGRSPAQRMLGLRCWLPGSRRVAGREQTALRQITGFCLNGQLLSGFFIWLTGKQLRSVGDFFADTVILHDPAGVLQLSSAASPGPDGAIL